MGENTDTRSKKKRKGEYLERNWWKNMIWTLWKRWYTECNSSKLLSGTSQSSLSLSELVRWKHVSPAAGKCDDSLLKAEHDTGILAKTWKRRWAFKNLISHLCALFSSSRPFLFIIFLFRRLMKQDNNRICPGNRLTLVVIQARMMSQWAVKSSVNGSYLCSALVTEKEIISRGESLRITDALFPLQGGIQRLWTGL